MQTSTELGDIPKVFCRELDGVQNKDSVITSGKGSWRVKISKGSEGDIYFEEGWSEFVQSHELIIGDFLVFKYKGTMQFHVMAFGPDACQKEFPLKVHDGIMKKTQISTTREYKGDNWAWTSDGQESSLGIGGGYMVKRQEPGS
ncbi:putative B3 domain-containing protein REM7 [Forsythia ovata]|uniref:B3 domain-containing protein REM7 n=1 Tax=Forsythia ovata TaxID=205694 RepID=A0ABD1P5M6_9LAMI